MKLHARARRPIFAAVLLSLALPLAALPLAANAFDLNPFGHSEQDATAPASTNGGTGMIEVGFSPRGHAMDLAVKAIGSARSTLDIAAYEFTSKRIANAVRAALARGVRVRIAVDAKENLGRKNSIAYELAAAGAQVRYIDAYPIMHDRPR